MGFFWTIGNSNFGNSWEQKLQQLRARSGRLFEGRNSNYGQLGTTTAVAKRPLFWMRHQMGTKTTAAKRPPSWIQATAIKKWVLGTKATKRPPFLLIGQQLPSINGSLLYWSSAGNNYGREAAAFLNSSNCNKYWVFFGQLGLTTAAKRPSSWI